MILAILAAALAAAPATRPATTQPVGVDVRTMSRDALERWALSLYAQWKRSDAAAKDAAAEAERLKADNAELRRRLDLVPANVLQKAEADARKSEQLVKAGRIVVGMTMEQVRRVRPELVWARIRQTEFDETIEAGIYENAAVGDPGVGLLTRPVTRRTRTGSIRLTIEGGKVASVLIFPY